MKIDSAYVGMESARTARSFTTAKRSSISTFIGGELTGSELASNSFSDLLGQKEDNEKEGKEQANALTDRSLPMEIWGNKSTILSDAIERMNSSATKKLSNPRDVTSQFQKMHEMFIQSIMELLFGHGKSEKVNACAPEEADLEMPKEQPVQLIVTRNVTEFTYQEFESTSFNAAGVIKTEDGRTINLNLNIQMTSSFTEVYRDEVDTFSTRCVDPLVINMSDAPAGLKDLKFLFDLDADGEAEEISYLDANSGYLALDKNGDGIINDGSELFGTSSGDGFKDLAAYDEDHNGWIDENDSIFEKLKIWVKGENGEDILYTLKDKDIGAICLQNQDTELSLHSANAGADNGYIRKTGIFLYENGMAGTVQHVDLVS